MLFLEKVTKRSYPDEVSKKIPANLGWDLEYVGLDQDSKPRQYWSQVPQAFLLAGKLLILIC